MAYVRRNWVDYPDTTTPIDADALNNIEDGIEESHNIQLLAVTDTAPSECAEGDKYYDTTTKLIYTATGTDTWGETGETPIYDILYIVLDEQTSYTYNGTTLVSVGGGNGGETLPVGSEIDYDGSTVPTGWELTTPIIESGTDYIKYYDGTMICYGRATISTSINIQYGSVYRTDLLSITLPQTFVDTNYRVFLQPYAPMHVCYMVDADKTTNLFKFYGVGFVSQGASADRQIEYVVIGKWK